MTASVSGYGTSEYPSIRVRKDGLVVLFEIAEVGTVLACKDASRSIGERYVNKMDGFEIFHGSIMLKQ